jgi:hypothetical protein
MSAKSVCDGLGRAHEFVLALEKVGFDDETIQRVINSRGNRLAKAMYIAITGEVQADERFEKVNEFDVVVPEGYNHATRLATFREAHEKEFGFFNGDITDQNFAKATTKLTPGRKFRVKVFQITEMVNSEDCLAKIRAEKGVLVGAQGASLAYEQGKSQLPVGRWSPSFDEKDALPVVGGYHRVPGVCRSSVGGFGFNLGVFGSGWWGGVFCLLVFCDLESA